MGRAALLLALTGSLAMPCVRAAPPRTPCSPRTASASRPAPPQRPALGAVHPAGGHCARGPAPAHTRAAAPRTSGAHPTLELGATDITGNRELPKVMYIVPWKHPKAGARVLEPPDTLVDEVLSPLDREVFRRRIRYFRALDSATAGAAPKAVAPHGDRRPP